jgi:TPR repeat protein
MAADQGLPIGQYQLGFYYYHGAGVPKDIVQALKWNRKAADQGYEPALQAMGAYRPNKMK